MFGYGHGPWHHHHHMWHHGYYRPFYPMGCGCLPLMLLTLFFCVAWAFFGALGHMWW
jgi:hypothetical protein